MSFQYLNSLGYDEKTKLYSYEIIDSEFKEITTICSMLVGGADVAVIQVYSKRNLNVAKNFFLFMLYFQKEHTYWIFEKQIAYYKKYIPEHFNKYEEELNNYMALI